MLVLPSEVEPPRMIMSGGKKVSAAAGFARAEGAFCDARGNHVSVARSYVAPSFKKVLPLRPPQIVIPRRRTELEKVRLAVWPLRGVGAPAVGSVRQVSVDGSYAAPSP